MIRQNIKSNAKMEVKKVLAKGGVWERLMTDQLESMSDQIEIQGDVYISTLQADTLHFDSFISIDENDSTHHQWMLAVHDHFDDGLYSHWKGDALLGLDSCVQKDDFFLSLSQGSVSTLYSLPPHTHLMLEGNLHVFDLWQGQTISASFDGHLFFNQSFSSQAHQGRANSGPRPAS